MANKPFALIGVNSDSDREKLKPVRKKENITWRSFWNGKKGTRGPISQAWGVQGWPTLYVLDAEGRIRYKSSGAPSVEIIDGWIETLLKELESKGSN